MTTDYDAPRTVAADSQTDNVVEELTTESDPLLGDDESAEPLDIPVPEIAGEELSVRVVPEQEDEFTCARCFLVHHRTQLAGLKDDSMICVECA
jgi:hypothetical protein